MSIACMILGQSGTGKTTSLRNLNPADVLLIQAVKKPLPFRSNAWSEVDPKVRTDLMSV
jgi:ABC-type sugar transport system ATPase subunit